MQGEEETEKYIKLKEELQSIRNMSPQTVNHYYYAMSNEYYQEKLAESEQHHRIFAFEHSLEAFREKHSFYPWEYE
jgi:hypothetical protein